MLTRTQLMAMARHHHARSLRLEGRGRLADADVNRGKALLARELADLIDDPEPCAGWDVDTTVCLTAAAAYPDPIHCEQCGQPNPDPVCAECAPPEPACEQDPACEVLPGLRL